MTTYLFTLEARRGGGKSRPWGVALLDPRWPDAMVILKSWDGQIRRASLNAVIVPGSHGDAIDSELTRRPLSPNLEISAALAPELVKLFDGIRAALHAPLSVAVYRETVITESERADVGPDARFEAVTGAAWNDWGPLLGPTGPHHP